MGRARVPGEPTGPILTRREMLRRSLAGASLLALPFPLLGCPARPEGAPIAEELGREDSVLPNPPSEEDLRRLLAWVEALRQEGMAGEVPFPRSAARVGELATGTPYEAFTLEEYLRAGGSPFRTEPLQLDLTRFDCVSLVEACLAIARLARRPGEPTWASFALEMERMRYRGGERAGYSSRLHYFSEWISDGAARGLVADLGEELGGRADRRPLRFMTQNRESYPALEHPRVVEEIAEAERALDDRPRWVVPTARIPAIQDRLETGDVVAFATGIEGLDVTHAAFAYRDEVGTLRVLHAPLSGGVVEITRSTLVEYVRAIRGATGILVARPLPAV